MGHLTVPSNFRYDHEKFCKGGSMGELIGSSTGFQADFSLVSGLVCLAALGIYALTQKDTGSNDDDDSSPGGGLMQPVA
jgi:hypothetical protein